MVNFIMGMVVMLIAVSLFVAFHSKPDKPQCEHKWKCIKQTEHRIFDEPWDKYPSEKYMEKTWECEKCKEIKHTYYDL